MTTAQSRALTARALTARATTRRMLMLVTVLLASASTLIGEAVLTYHSATSLPHCASAAGMDLQGPEWRTELGLRFHQKLVACRADGARTALYATVLWTAGVAVAAVLLYRWLPRWRQRKDRLPELYSAQRIAAAMDGDSGGDERLAHLARLARRAKLPQDRLPGFVCNPRALSAGALAFGSFGRYTVCLNVGLLPRRTTKDRPHFDAVVLHELAHVRNRDVDLAYLAVALWRVFLIAVLLPCLALDAALVLHDRFQSVERAYWDGYEPGAKTALLAVVLTALVYVARADILRHRELVADRDAVFESGSDREVWKKQAESRSAALPRHRLPRFLRNHPTWSERLAEIDNPRSEDKGGTKLQLAVFLVAYVTITYSVISWLKLDAVPAQTVIYLAYLLGPLIIATGFAVFPRRKARSADEASAARAWMYGVIWLIGAFAVNPFANWAQAEDDWAKQAAASLGEMADEIKGWRDGPAVSAAAKDRAAGWYERGGSAVLGRFDTYLPDQAARSDAADAHCAALGATVSDALELPVFPDSGAGGKAWKRLLTSAAEAQALQCRSGYDLDAPNEGAMVSMRYERARTALRQLMPH
ncbi:M48 family metalloprotease [Streptomyces olivochromogenes]|uniref:M48 family metalloprotease n=1 Tax=Streptomyces olivochromogenes TaxID=1963 RepID=UPI001F207746|nr:M48 family metalloprotease [Streptomyces olivochromogenes]